MFPFFEFGPFDRAERKALIVAAIACFFFIAFIASLRPRDHAPRAASVPDVPYTPSASIPPKEMLVSSTPAASGDAFVKYRIKSEDFYDVDFWNYSYGPYTLSDGKKINLTLLNSRLDLPDNPDSFALKDVYYKDVTGDGRAEAIVWMSHWNCAGPCTSSQLFYIYTVQKHKLKPIWQYESSYYVQGCGLKSLTIAGTEIMLELFGDCRRKLEDSGESKNATFITLKFDGRGFRQRSVELVDAAPMQVSDYEPGIRIF